jgi:hypothetical protein
MHTKCGTGIRNVHDLWTAGSTTTIACSNDEAAGPGSPSRSLIDASSTDVDAEVEELSNADANRAQTGGNSKIDELCDRIKEKGILRRVHFSCTRASMMLVS